MTSILRVYTGDGFIEKDLTGISKISVGHGNTDGVNIEDASLKRNHVRLELASDGWCFQAAQNVFYQGKQMTGGMIAFGEMLVINPEERIAVTIYETQPDYSQIVDINSFDVIVIGRSSSCDISVGSALISAKHLELRRTASGWEAADLNSSNGTYLNARRMERAGIVSGDVLDIGLSRLILTGEQLTISFSGPTKINLVQQQAPKSIQNDTDEYPNLFKRSPRLREELPCGEIEFQSPPTIGAKPTISWVSVLVPPIATVAIMLTVCFLLSGAMTMLYFSVPMTLVGLLMSIVNYRSQKKKYFQTEQIRLDKYQKYLEEKKQEIIEKQNNQRRILTNIHPASADCVRIAAELSRRLWERKPSDDDFMALRVGEGQIDSCITFRTPKQILTIDEDALSDRPQQIADTYQKVEHCPIVYTMKKNPTCGMIGDRSKCIALVKNLILQAATHHSYNELKIVLVCNAAELSEWEFTKWLPHSFDNTRSGRYIVNNSASAKQIFSQMEETLSIRCSEHETTAEQNKQRMELPYCLFICADRELMEHQSIMKYLTSNEAWLGVGALFLFDSLDNLPKECGVLIEMQGRNGKIYHKDNTSGKAEFTLDPVREDLYEVFSRSLAPVRIEQVSGEKSLPTSVSFLQGYCARQPREIDIDSAWKNPRPETSMAVPIGVRTNGEPCLFDIHEKRQGPHGLVAGMTGSGKSEMVQSWILSMALKFPPEAVSFVLIDFKGTGLILPFQNLPHLAGTVSDLDTNITRNLMALENELNRRKLLFDQYGTSNISGYLKLYRQGKAEEALSYLFVVIDEFAEFKSQFPEFMQVVNRIFATGRTLGVHIILLTQKPTSVVDDKMNANTRFRWCLKVASSADSKDMLRRPDAAKITNPGRAYVLVGEDETYEQIQSYWSGAPYNPYRALSLQRSNKVSVVDLYGGKISYEPEKTTGFRSEQNEIDAIVDYIDNYTRKNEIPRAKNIWTNKLKSEIELAQVLQIAFDGEHWNENESGLCPAVGMIDDPRSQSQYPLKLNLAENGHIVIYGAPGTGKTTFLHSVIMSLGLSYSPDIVSLYLMDFGGGSLNLFRLMPHVGGVARDYEEEKIDKLCKLLTKELEQRKKLLSDVGVVSIDSYREVSGEKLPYIVLILDNFAPVLNLYPDMDLFFQNLTREGGNYGIYFISTANTQTTISYRISQSITNPIALRMADQSDYAAIVGRTEGLEPENFPGRGLIKGKPPLEFQTVLPAAGKTEHERVIKIRELVERMNEKWEGHRPAPIPVMPETVRVQDYKTDDIIIGLSTEYITPVFVSLRKKQFLVISEAPGCDASELLRLMVSQIPARMRRAEIIAYDSPENGLLNLEGVYKKRIASAAEFDQYIADLMPILQERKTKREATGHLSADDATPIVIVIDNLKYCFDAASEETVKRLSNIVNLGIGLHIFLLVSGHCEDISKLSHGGDVFTASLVRQSAALLVGGSMNKHSAFQADLSYTEASIELSGHEGYVVSDGQALKVKFVQQP